MKNEEKKKEFPPVHHSTEGLFHGIPTLALPTSNPTRPVIMTLPKWRLVMKHFNDIQVFLAKHKDFDPVRKTAEPPVSADAKRKELLADLL